MAISRFVYFDPKLRPGADDRGVRPSSRFKSAIAFVVGGGNYSEYENLIEHVEGNIVYGATSLVTGEQYLRILEEPTRDT